MTWSLAKHRQSGPADARTWLPGNPLSPRLKTPTQNGALGLPGGRHIG